MKLHVVAAIFARGGSKGLPRKNLRLLGDKPLIAYAIQTARASSLIDRVVVSTEDVEIAEAARRYGADVPFMRPIELARDDSREWDAWRHAINALQGVPGAQPIDVFVSVPPPAPLRSVEDVEACIHCLLDSDADVTITVRQAERNPYFNMVTLNGTGEAKLAIQPSAVLHRRQDAPQVYDMTTVAYAARPEFILRANSIFDGKVRAVIVPRERALDIDTELDLEFAEFLLSQGGNQKRT